MLTINTMAATINTITTITTAGDELKLGDVVLKHALTHKGDLGFGKKPLIISHNFNIKLEAPDPLWYIIGGSVFIGAFGVLMIGAGQFWSAIKSKTRAPAKGGEAKTR